MPQNYDMGPTALLPLRRKACWGFFRPKNPTASAGFEPANLGTKSQHATPRPPKPLTSLYVQIKWSVFVLQTRCVYYEGWTDVYKLCTCRGGAWAQGWVTQQSRVDCWQRQEMCLFSNHPDCPRGHQTVAHFLSQAIMWLKHEASHAPPFGAEFKNWWSYTSTPPYALMACRGRDNFIIYSFIIYVCTLWE
jgi:hypothetical protein